MLLDNAGCDNSDNASIADCVEKELNLCIWARQCE